MPHAFDEAIAVSPVDERRFAARTSPAYANMVSPFGGATAATVLAALQSRPDALGDPLALTVNYLAPLEQGDWTIAPRLLRTNRTNQHWSFIGEQNGVVALSGTAVFAVARDTWADGEAKAPPAEAPTAYPRVEFPEFVVWAQNYESRFVTGEAGADGPSEDSTSTYWIRDSPPRPLDYPALTALSDSFFPRVFLRRGGFMPAGTVTLTIYYHATQDELAAHGGAHVLATARAARFGHGHFDQYGQLFGGGTLLAATHQLMYFKDPK